LCVLGSSKHKPPLRFQEVMIPMRDGVRLETVILTPVNASEPLPILLQRTPYGVPDKAPDELRGSFKELSQDGYIFVFQNLRGRFKSEGTFRLSSWVDLNDPKAVNETTDAYDTIDWLIKNVPNNNGRAGIFGVSYLGLTAGMTLLHPHPALKAVSEQAAPVDQWINDDMHRYGALRLSYALEYSVMEQADKHKNTHFDFDTYDTYEWYRRLGPVANVNAKYLHGSVPFWNDIVEHPDYDTFWKREAWVDQLHSSPVPNLNVAGFWDQEDPWGPWQIFRHSEEKDPAAQNFMVAGPWFHGEWQHDHAESIGEIPFGGHDTAREFHQNIEAPFFATICTDAARNSPGRRARSSPGRIPGIPMTPGRHARPSLPTYICTLTEACRSTAPPMRMARPSSSNTSPTRLIPSPTAANPSRRPTLVATGPPGKPPTSASSTAGPTSCAL
jgi:predicted acyl esterase